MSKTCLGKKASHNERPYRSLQSLNHIKPSGLVRSKWVCFGMVWCVLVRFGVIYTFFLLIDVLWCHLGVIWFWLICCDLILVWFGRSGFVLVWFGVFWCGWVLFVKKNCANQCFMVWFEYNLVRNDLVWFYSGLVRSEFLSFSVWFWFGVFFVVVWWLDGPKAYWYSNLPV